MINCAGHIADGEAFFGSIDRLVTAVDSLPSAASPCPGSWRAPGLLHIDSFGRRGVDLPKVKSTYWLHRVNSSD